MPNFSEHERLNYRVEQQSELEKRQNNFNGWLMKFRGEIVKGINNSAEDNWKKLGLKQGFHSLPYSYRDVPDRDQMTWGESTSHLVKDWLGYSRDENCEVYIKCDAGESSHSDRVVVSAIWNDPDPAALAREEEERRARWEALTPEERARIEAKNEASRIRFENSPIGKLMNGDPTEWLMSHGFDNTMRALIDYDEQHRGEI